MTHGQGSLDNRSCIWYNSVMLEERITKALTPAVEELLDDTEYYDEADGLRIIITALQKADLTIVGVGTGLDRLVRLGDVVKALEAHVESRWPVGPGLADDTRMTADELVDLVRGL